MTALNKSGLWVTTAPTNKPPFEPPLIPRWLLDVMFSLINVSRYLEADPEIELKKSIQTFINRAKYVEKHINKETDINVLWQEAKKNQIDS